MAQKLNGATDYDKLKDLCTKTYKEQVLLICNHQLSALIFFYISCDFWFYT